MKLCFPVSTFNAHTYFFAMSEKRLHQNMQKTRRTTQSVLYLTTEQCVQQLRKIKAMRSESSSFSYAKL